MGPSRSASETVQARRVPRGPRHCSWGGHRRWLLSAHGVCGLPLSGKWRLVWKSWAGLDAGTMQELWSQCLKRLKEAPDAALEWGRSGVAFLKSSVGSLPFLAGTSADTAAGNPERDETHYFLVPDPTEAGGFTLAERRRLPEGA